MKNCMCWCFINYWIEKCKVKQWNYQHFNYLNHVSYFGEKMSYRYCAGRMQYYYMLSATVTGITSPVHPTSMSINYNTFHDSGMGQDIKFTKDICSRQTVSLFSWISHINWSCNHTMLYSAIQWKPNSEAKHTVSHTEQPSYN